MDSKTIYLPGKHQGWFPTGIYGNKGDVFRIEGSGRISFGPFGSWPFEPNGELARKAGGGAPFPGATANSLVARAGGVCEYIGYSGQIKVHSDVAHILIALNDDYAADNDGTWTVTIQGPFFQGITYP